MRRTAARASASGGQGAAAGTTASTAATSASSSASTSQAIAVTNFSTYGVAGDNLRIGVFTSGAGVRRPRETPGQSSESRDDDDKSRTVELLRDGTSSNVKRARVERSEATALDVPPAPTTAAATAPPTTATTTAPSQSDAAPKSRPLFRVRVVSGTTLLFPNDCDVIVEGDVANLQASNSRLRLAKGAMNATLTRCETTVSGTIMNLTQNGGTVVMRGPNARVHSQRVTSGGIGALLAGTIVNHF